MLNDFLKRKNVNFFHFNVLTARKIRDGSMGLSYQRPFGVNIEKLAKMGNFRL